MKKLQKIVKTYIPLPSLCIFIFTLIAAVIHLVSELSVGFSDFFNRYIGSFFRGIFATVTSIIPFSLAECVIISLPVLAVAIIYTSMKRIDRSKVAGVRSVVALASAVAYMYSMFVVTTVVAYNGSPLSEKLELEEKPVSVDELIKTSEYMISGMSDVIDEVDFLYAGKSVMPYSISELNKKLLEAYESLAKKQDFLPTLTSKIKQVALSEPMTYTHISGMYTYYTGEANLNVNFPDYTLPFTAAHELAHQRGILPENEANFVAFLVCIESDDPYIKYSGWANMYEYVSSALYRADYDSFAEVYSKLDPRFTAEMRSYNAFFEKYRDNVAADVSSTLNDNYLKAQGQTAGEKSYGMVVDLAVALVNKLTEG